MKKRFKFWQFLCDRAFVSLHEIGKEKRKQVWKIAHSMNACTWRQTRKSVVFGMVVISMMISFISPIQVRAADETVVEVTTKSELSKAIDNARNKPDMVVIKVLESMTMTSVKWMIGSNIKLIGTKDDIVIDSAASADIFALENSHLELENITIRYTGSSPRKSNIRLTSASSLIMQQGALLQGNKNLICFDDSSRNQVIMNSGAKLDASSGGTAIQKGLNGTGSVIMNENSVIEGGGSGSGIIVGGNSEVYINGGIIQNCKRGINVEGANSLVQLNYGRLTGSDSTPTSTGVSVNGTNMDTPYVKQTTLLMKDGMIIENNTYSGVYISGGAEFTMEGGTIRNNSGIYGGGVWVSDNGEFYMKGGSVENNKAANYGGGIELFDSNSSTSGAKVVITGGVIRSNEAKYGGGIYVGDQHEEGLFLNGGTITENTADQGGGVYVKNNGLMDMRAGNIQNNHARGQGGGIGVYGTVDLSGGTIIENTADLDGSGVYFHSGKLGLSDDITIRDNQNAKEAKHDNLFIGRSNSTIMYPVSIKGKLTGQIGYTTSNKKENVWFGEGIEDYTLTDEDASAFLSDEGMGVVLQNNKLWLAKAPETTVITKNLDERLQMVELDQKATLSISSETDDVKYEWYQNDKAAIEGAQIIAGEKQAKLNLKTDKVGTYYYFVKMTVTKNHVSKSIVSNIAHIVVYEKQENKGTIQGSIESDGDTDPAAGVQITIMRGSTVLSATTTNALGEFVFHDVPYGVYNLVAVKDQQEVTKKVIVDQDLIQLTAKLPKGMKNTVVEIIGTNTPPVVVSGLNELFDTLAAQSNQGITASDQQILSDGGKVELKVLAQTKQASEIPEAAVLLQRAAKSNKHEIGMMIDIAMMKTVTDKNGIESVVILNEINQTIEITIELNDALQAQGELYIYRIHNDQSPELLTMDKTADEYYERNGKYLKIYAKKYSIYAIGFDEEKEDLPIDPDAPEQPGTKPESNSGNSVQTGDSTMVMGWNFMMLGSTGVLGIAQFKLRQLYQRRETPKCLCGMKNKWRFIKFLFTQALHDLKNSN